MNDETEERMREAGFLDPGYSYRVPPHVQAAISRLKMARDDLRAVKLNRSKFECSMIADTIDRAIAELKGERVRYPALEAENDRAAAE